MFVCLCEVVSVSVSLPDGLCLFVSVRWYLLVVYVCLSLSGDLYLFVSVRWYLLVCLCKVFSVSLSLSGALC